MPVRCVDCYFLGYRREEVQKGGEGFLDTIHRHPESLPLGPRALLEHADGALLQHALASLRAHRDRLTCLRIGRDGTPVNPDLGAAPPGDDGFDTVRVSALRPRECADSQPADPTLPYSVYVDMLDEQQRMAARARAESAMRRRSLNALSGDLEALDTSSMTPQARGLAFERWLGGFLRVYGVSPSLNVVNCGEQIDVTFWHGQLFVIGEARWRAMPVDTPQVRDFFGKLLERPPFTLGLVLSLGGFTEPAAGYLSRHAGSRTVLMASRGDLAAWLAASPEFPAWLELNLRRRLDHP